MDSQPQQVVIVKSKSHSQGNSNVIVILKKKGTNFDFGCDIDCAAVIVDLTTGFVVVKSTVQLDCISKVDFSSFHSRLYFQSADSQPTVKPSPPELSFSF